MQQSASEAANGLIHSDIEAGMQETLENRLAQAVRIGSIAGIQVSMRDLLEAWKHAQTAANARFEPAVGAGEWVLPDKVREICRRHLQEGLESVFGVTKFEVISGAATGIVDEPKKVGQLYDVAAEFGIPLTFIPKQIAEAGEENKPAVVLTSKEQAIAYLNTIIELNLPQGLNRLVREVGYSTADGLLANLPHNKEKIEEWISVMERRGWQVVDQPQNAISDEGRSGILPRQINRAEIRQLIDQMVKDNLIAGSRYIADMVAYNVGSGYPDPLSTWGNRGNIALYVEAAEKYGLVQGRDEGTSRSEGVLDFDNIQQQVTEAVSHNLPAGLSAIVARHLQGVRVGDISQVNFAEQTLAQYHELAKVYGVGVSADQSTASLRSHITAENLSAGVATLMASIKDQVRKGEYSFLSLEARRAEDLRRFVSQNGLNAAVDFSGLDGYMKETATQLPQLTG
jgi:hypothetical protein